MFERAKIKVSFFNYSFGKMFCVHGNCKIKTSTTLQQVQSKTHHKVSHITKNNKDYRCKFTKGQLRHTSYHKFLFNRAMLEGMKHLWAKEVYKGGTLYICSWCQPVFTIDRVWYTIKDYLSFSCHSCLTEQRYTVLLLSYLRLFQFWETLKQQTNVCMRIIL